MTLREKYAQIVQQLNNLYKHNNYIKDEILDLEEELTAIGYLLEFQDELPNIVRNNISDSQAVSDFIINNNQQQDHIHTTDTNPDIANRKFKVKDILN